MHLWRIKNKLFWKMKFLKQADCIGYVITKVLKYVKISKRTSSNSFFTEFSFKLKSTWNEFPRHIFVELFDKIFVRLHKLVKFHSLIVSPPPTLFSKMYFLFYAYTFYAIMTIVKFKPLSAYLTKWSNTLKQFVGNGGRIVWVCLTILWDWRLKG